MLDYCPARRITARTALQHPYFDDIRPPQAPRGMDLPQARAHVGAALLGALPAAQMAVAAGAGGFAANAFR